eukprot:TRINITY_DN56091_c0_g2_i1.p1 TRINITY_DN56091_c0_g2~~TRINITY_DN56091_c0_g2_i1.p1  ORF type:complete len:353 (+),score=29.80 TRINITY_DN56091_c0_g2_i1:1-1059(+)
MKTRSQNKKRKLEVEESQSIKSVHYQKELQYPILMQLGQLVKGKVIKRPSAQIRTPYVADVQIDNKEIVMAHTPALDCAGMIVPDATVYMTQNQVEGKKSSQKTSHSVKLGLEKRENGMPSVLVGAHPSLAEKIVQQALEKRLLKDLGQYHLIEQEKTFKNMRVDFVLTQNTEQTPQNILLEVKNVVCADYPEGQVPEGRSKVGVYTSNKQPYKRTAIFPHGVKKAGIKVVSDRAIKQLHTLVQMQQEGYKCSVLFIVNRDDCEAFRPCHEADMLFAQMLLRASEQGIIVLAHSVAWSLDGVGRWAKPLPVVFDESVKTEDINEEHLQKVLDFNAQQKRTNNQKKNTRQVNS